MKQISNVTRIDLKHISEDEGSFQCSVRYESGELDEDLSLWLSSDKTVLFASLTCQEARHIIEALQQALGMKEENPRIYAPKRVASSNCLNSDFIKMCVEGE